MPYVAPNSNHKLINPAQKSCTNNLKIFVFMDCLDNRGPANRRGLTVLCKRKNFEPFLPTTVKWVNFTKNNPMAIQVGQTAPNFSLYNSAKEKVSLSDFAGKSNVLLLFFPQAFTGVCTKELCAVRDDIARYNQSNAQVFGVSVDSVFTLAKFKEEQQYNFPLLSDFNKEVSEMYGSIYASFTDMGMKGVSKRSAFVIDKQGVIQYAEVLESAGDVPNFDAINDVLVRLN